jgi:two-component system OmpR family sensor kinase
MAVLALVLTGAGVLIAHLVGTYLLNQVDNQLHLAVSSAGRAGLIPGSRGSVTDLYVGWVQDDGSVVSLVAPSVGTESLPKVPAQQAWNAAQDDEPKPFTVSDEQGHGGRYRMLAVPTRDPTRVLVIAKPLSTETQTYRHLIELEVGAGAILLGTLGLVTIWVLQLGLRPLKAMTATAEAVAAGELSHRVDILDSHTEAGRLGVALNGMLDRIENAFDAKEASEDRLRRFVADASHELRTPVTSIRGYAELYRHGALPDDRLDDAMRRIEGEAVRMGGLVEDLLLLARLDQGRPIEHGRVDLAVVAADCVADAEVRSPNHPMQLEADHPVYVAGDAARLHQVVTNLLANAATHTPDGTEVTVRVLHDADGALVEVADNGPGMDATTSAKAFERFFRGDPSRHRDAAGSTSGSGLGLSIVQAIVAAHKGTVSLESAPGEGTTVRVRIPATIDAPPATPWAAPSSGSAPSTLPSGGDGDPALDDYVAGPISPAQG